MVEDGSDQSDSLHSADGQGSSSRQMEVDEGVSTGVWKDVSSLRRASSVPKTRM